MSRQPYRTQSDTLKLQRLISVLKERGSDLGSSLESQASNFLSDVKPKSLTSSGTDCPASTYSYGLVSGGRDRVIPHYTGDCEDEGSSYGDASECEDDMEDTPQEAAPKPDPVRDKSPDPPLMPTIIEPQGMRPPPPKPRPKAPPPPVPEDEEPLTESVRRRSSLLKALRKDSGIATMMKKQLGVRFKEPSPNDDEDSADGHRSQSRNNSVGNLLKTSALMLQSLTLNISKEDEEEAVGQSALPTRPDPAADPVPANEDSFWLLGPSQSATTEHSEVVKTAFEEDTEDNRSINPTPGMGHPPQVNESTESDSAGSTPHITVSHEGEVTESEESFFSGPENASVRDADEADQGQDGQTSLTVERYRKKQKSLTPKRKKKTSSTLATQWRKQRERKRSGSTSPVIFICSEDLETIPTPKPSNPPAEAMIQGSP